LDAGYFLPYNNSKAEGERIVRNAVSKGLNAVIITPTGMIGPYDFRPSHFGMSLLAMAKAKLPALVDAGLNWVDTRDVAGGMIRSSEHAQTGAKYILSGHWVPLSDIAQWVTGITGAKAPQVVLPMWLAKTGAALGTLFGRVRGRRPLVTPISMKELESNKNISHAKASKELGYEPRPLQQTIADTVDWFRSYGFLGPNYP
jgi:dihydroflavonol-4-reductase